MTSTATQASGGQSQKKQSATADADGQELVAVVCTGTMLSVMVSNQAMALGHIASKCEGALCKAAAGSSRTPLTEPARLQTADRPWHLRAATVQRCVLRCAPFRYPATTSSMDVTASCATSTMTSPALTFLSAAGLAGSTSSTITPLTLRAETMLGAQLVGEGRQHQPDQRAPRGRPRPAVLVLALVPALGRDPDPGRGAGFASSARRPTATLTVFLWPLRTISTSTSLPICVCATMRGSPRIELHVLAVEFQNHVAVQDAGLGGWTILRDAGDERAAVFLDTRRLRPSRR